MPRKQIDTELVALLDLIEGDRFSHEEIKRYLRGYRCSRDRDVETYLQRYAYTNERNGTSRTYLVIDYDKYDGENLPPIVAYFTLAIAEAKIAEAMRLVGGRVIYLDCKRSEFLIHLYEESGYEVLDVASVGDHPVKMVKVPQI